MKNNDITHFGYQSVPTREKNKRVTAIFDAIAPRYDLMNDVMTGGLHRLWKRYTIELSGIHQGQSVLDLAGGTGDLTLRFSKLAGKNGRVILADINQCMLRVSQDRIAKSQDQNINIIQANAEHLPFADNTFDCISVAFGLRNITNKQLALDSINRTLKPGGRLLILEFSKPKGAILSRLCGNYSFKLLPTIGQLITGHRAPYRYLAESIHMHPDQNTLKSMLQKAGFKRVDHHNLSGGIVAVHRGFKA
jgi:demethylmenaquinone methyltransferase/2-methoxy-6-polyprenyl-1,4-benzoquinol methylase